VKRRATSKPPGRRASEDLRPPKPRDALPPRPWVESLNAVDEALRAAGSPQRAEGARAYLKSTLRFYGTTIPELRRRARDLRRRHPDTSRGEVRAVVHYLWQERIFERRTLGLLLLEEFQPRLDRRDLPFLRELAFRGHWWNFVDHLAVHLAGPIVATTDRDGHAMEVWSQHPDLWVRRAGLLALLPGLKDGSIEFRVFERLAVPRLPERDFFMRKALGWILREVGRSQPSSVARFLRRHRDQVSPLTRRESIKYLPAKFRKGV
jgi:3-methyladenine DNA glycosylase AlkD